MPAGNLCAWMWVAAWYGGMTRLVRGRITLRGEPRWHRALVPLFAYTGLFCSLFIIGAAGQLLGLTTHNQRLWIFAAHLLGFLTVVVFASRLQVSDPQRMSILRGLTWNRWLMHASFFLLLWAGGVWRQMPPLIAVSLLSMLAEWSAQRWCVRRAVGGE